MTTTAEKPFPTYLEMRSRVPIGFWWALRITTFAVMLIVLWLVATRPSEGFAIFWKVLIPSLPMVFAVAPGLWRQICPMAFLNQLPRTFGFSQERTLPIKLKNLAYFVSVLSFFILVSLRHVVFNKEPAALLALVLGALALAFIGGLIFKGRSGWCGTFCPLAPIQKAYGHMPIVTVRNGYCPTCVGCQKNCYDFNPRAAIFSDLGDKDLWYAGHKKFFVAGLPGFAIGFFNAQDPSVTGFAAYYLYMALWIVTTLGIYMAVRVFVRVTDFQAASLSALSALVIFYWYTGAGFVSTLTGLLGIQVPLWSNHVPFALSIAVAVVVLYRGRHAERAFVKLNVAPAEPKVAIRAGALPGVASGGQRSDEVILERSSGRSFVADPAVTLLDGIESAGLKMDFGCRMGMCGADPIAVIDGHENLVPPTDDETATLRRLGLEGRARLACVCKVARGGVTIDLGIKPGDLPEPPPTANPVDLGIQANVGKVVIVGNGAAGMAAADEIRRLSASCSIDVVSRENHHFYNRMSIARLLYGRTGLEDLYLMAPDWYEKKSVTVWLNTQVVAIDRQGRQVQLGTGEFLPYDKLILAMGSSAATPTVEGMSLPGCFVLREAADAQGMRAWRQEHACTHAVVLGGGVLGIEAAEALRRLNLKTTIVQRSDRLMNRELDEKGSAVLKRYLEGLGIRVITGASTTRIVGTDRVRQIVLDSGEALEADIYVTCAGVQANVALARTCGLEVNRGIIVDSSMRTSDPDIVAIGDVAELPNAVSGLWSVATSQAVVAAATIFGAETAYSPPSTLVRLKMEGIDVMGFGRLEALPGGEEIVAADEEEHVRRRLFVAAGQITGAVFVGPPGTGRDIAQAVQKRADISTITASLKSGDWSALAKV